LPADQPYWQSMRAAASSLAERYGYHLIETPILEATELFERTASVLRAYFQGRLDQEPGPARLYYLQPLVRPDREVHQFGVEAIGEAAPGIDVEVIELGWRWFEVLRIMGVSLQITITDDGDGVLGGLRGSGVPFFLNSRREPALGRERRTAFEYWHQDAGDAPTVLGGGSRHDELAEELGFPPTPAIGFALDMDRTAIVLKQQHPQPVRGPDVYAVPTETSSLSHVHWLVTALRQRGYKVILDASAATLETKLQKAAARGARVALMAGPALDSSGQAVVRDLQKQEQVTVWDADVPDAVRRVFVASHRHEGPIG